MSLTKVIQFFIVLLAIPSVADAHSGTVVRAAVSYIPLALAFIAILSRPLAELIKKIQSIFKRERD